MTPEIILTFSSSTYAIASETILLEANFPVKVMPLPSSLGAGCGLCLRLPLEHQNGGLELLQKENLFPQNIYQKQIENNKTIYIPLKEEANLNE